MKAKISICLLLLICAYSYAQIDQYSYKRELLGITDQWHKVVLPEDIYGKMSPELSDIRIFGLTETNDTIEASYLLQLKTEKVVGTEVKFKLLNTTHNEKGYYFTMEVPTEDSVNQLMLNFKQDNFDWMLSLEGSQNQQEWFNIVDDHRILSIKNAETNYQFTKVTFPETKYRYFRVLIKSKEKPDLSFAKIEFNEVTNGSFNKYAAEKFESIEDKKRKLTLVEIGLKTPVPVSSIKIDVKNTFDYYRPITISYLSDSVKTEKGYKYQYRQLASGTLSSFEKNEFVFESTVLQKLKISIYNQDNASLTIQKLTAKGYVHELVVRFTEPATYFLAYGNKKATKPNYDIERFVSNIPDTLTALNFGKEQLIDQKEVLGSEPLFKNKNWLWAIMTLLIIVLGWFSVKMIKTK
ncbi:DUF3999 family protein [uncultured Eudoraea sp.]|uniref:DUF3999 family protein n=1 Tax=uncultured Eudoraea sp. TaxID=1035614 RepID=UPI002631E3FC|nr:DUF3999 family protein [uncultured Eudoraea sp.]